MKHTYQLVDFTCDNCGCTAPGKASFPYDHGWVYLYQLNFQKQAAITKPLPEQEITQRNVITDKHFYSIACLVDFTRRTLEAKP